MTGTPKKCTNRQERVKVDVDKSVSWRVEVRFEGEHTTLICDVLKQNYWISPNP